MIPIRSKRARFRRCGIAHPAEPVEYPDDRFTEEDLKSLKADPMLVVEVTTDKPTKTGAEGEATGDLASLTVDQLKTEIAKFQPIEHLKGLKKAELVDILSAHRFATVME